MRTHDDALGRHEAGALEEPSTPRNFRVVLAAVDVSGPDSHGVAALVLRAAEAIACDTSGRRAALHVLHAWTLLGESILSCPVRGLPRHRVRLLASRVRALRRGQVERLCRNALQRAPDAIHVQRGDPRSVIPGLARRVRADVLVVGDPERSGFGAFRFGGVALSLLGALPCDMLVVRGSAHPAIKEHRPSREHATPVSTPFFGA